MARTGGGSRGRVGAPTPKKGKPAKARAKTALPKTARRTTARTAREGQFGLKPVKAHAHLPQLRHGGFTCKSCGHMSFREHTVMAANGKPHPTLSMHGCARCGAMHPARTGTLKHHVDDVDVAKAYAAWAEESTDPSVEKDVDTSDTALQAEGPPPVGHRTNCPRGGSAPCGREVDGECARCGAMVRDHEALGKRGINATVLDLMKLAADL